LGFAFKAGQSRGVVCKLFGQQFDGDFTFQGCIEGTIDLSHASSPKGPEDFIVRQTSSR